MLDKRILAAIPVYHAVDPLPFMHFLNVCQETGRARTAGKYSVKWLVGGPKVKIQKVRNISCKAALDGGASHLAFIDDDMILEPEDIFERLLAHDKDIVSPLFFRSDDNFDPLVFHLNGDGEPHPILDYPKNTLFEVTGGVGTGMMLIKREVLEALGDPWFYFPERSSITMDLDFCLRAIRKGFKVWCDTSLIIKQMGNARPVGEEDFLRYSGVGLTTH
jgi:hypothetical protein